MTTMDRSQIVHSNPEILGGTPVFVGTRVPVFLGESASSLLAQMA
jgi:uncharacterized protein (DUF433 family)